MTRGIARARLAVLTASFIALGTTGALAEPMYLAKQYARCSTCHYSPTGGGLLTPYGRSLSHQELSTTGRNPLQGDAGTTALTGEEAFLYGMLKDTLGPVQLGVDLRPSRLEFSVNDFHDHRNLLMTLDALGAYRFGDWTLYGEIGREPQATGAKVGSYEYWVGHQSEKGFGFRVGRFLPAYGIRFADHTAFNRSNLGFDKYRSGVRRRGEPDFGTHAHAGFGRPRPGGLDHRRRWASGIYGHGPGPNRSESANSPGGIGFVPRSVRR